MILPANRLLIIAALWCASAVIVAFVPPLLFGWLLVSALIVSLVTLDAIRLLRQPLPGIKRSVAASLPQTLWCDVTLTIATASPLAQKMLLKDSPPEKCDYDDRAINVSLSSAQPVQAIYRIKPLMRGDVAFGRAHVRLFSPWQCWLRQQHLGETQRVSVYPNFAPIKQLALYATVTQAGNGIHQVRRRGQGMEFEQLREYRSGDALRQIDWKATTRVQKMISRHYQEERNQRIMLMLDCGRRMSASEGELTHFDRALDALLLLAYVGLRYGDSVGLLTLGGVARYLPPVRSVNAINRILHEVYDLQPTLHSSDIELAAQSLLARERKRCLVVLFTNLRDEDEQSLIGAVNLLNKRHLVLVASLRETALDKAASIPIQHAGDAALRAAAAEYQAKRQAVLTRLRQAGVLCLDVPPQQLAVQSVNHYLAIKAAGKL